MDKILGYFFIIAWAVGVTLLFDPDLREAAQQEVRNLCHTGNYVMISKTRGGVHYDRYSDGFWYRHGDTLEPGNRLIFMND